MYVMHIALGGCFRPPPVQYGLTEDTGGHIAYILGAAQAQARRADVGRVEIITRAFDDQQLGACYGVAEQAISPKCMIRRLRAGSERYLGKDELAAELPALTEAFLDMLSEAPRRPDLIHAHFADAAVLARAAAGRFSIPWFYSSHSLALDKGQAGAGTSCAAFEARVARERAAIAEATAIIASSRDEAERQIPAYDPAAEGRVFRVSPGVNSAQADSVQPARRLIAPFLRNPDLPIILAIARPVAKKNLATLVEAFGRDAELRKRANLVVLAGLRSGLTGQGAEADQVYAEMLDAVDRHDLWGHVALPKRHAQGDIAALYALASKGGVFANPALHEPFGLTLIEAAQAGVPLVATRNGGPADIVESLSAGRLIEPTDADDIARALRATLDDPQTGREAERARMLAHRLYDWNLWAARISEIYAEITLARLATPCPRAILACDLDGTLTGDAEAAARFARWARSRPAGVLFAVATGRSVVEARRVLSEWGLPAPDLFITSVGSEIWQWQGPGKLSPCPDYAARVSVGWDREAVLEAAESVGLTPQPVYDQRRWKISYFGNAFDAQKLRAALDAANCPARVIASHERLIDILPPQSGKADALRFAAKRLGLCPEECIVAGDSGNDLDLLQMFPRAIIPANAAAELDALSGPYRSVQSHADGVLDGLAHFGWAHLNVRAVG